MGCSPSKLEKEEAVQVCRDRRKFIKQAVEQRERFALGHINYIQSLRRVSFALLNYVEGNEHHNFFSDRYSSTPPFTPEKRRTSHDSIGGVALRSFESTPPPDEHAKSATTKVTNCFRPQGSNPSVPIEEWPESPETLRRVVEYSYYHSNHGYVDSDGFFVSEASGLNSSTFSTSPYNHSSRPSYPPTSPQDSQWDYFWNPFSTLDQYRYQFSNNPDEEMGRISTFRKEEGIPELEEVEKDDNQHDDHDNNEDNKNNIEDEKFGMTETKVDEDSRSDTKPSTIPVSFENSVGLNRERKKVNELKECQSQGMGSMEVSEAQNVEAIARNSGSEETPDFTVYVNRRPASMVEVIKDVENQFVRVVDSAREVSVMLEASRYIYSSSNQPTAGNDETASNYSEECCMKSGSHQSTMDRLYSWEKRLYEEVKCCERVRIAYEKKCKQLRKHDINGAEPSAVDKTRAAIRDLHTQLTISMRSVESVSRRIVTLRQEELYPQLLELMQGLARMWKTMADCHKIQKRTIDEAKLLLFSSSSSSTISMTTTCTDHHDAINPRRAPMGSKAAAGGGNLLLVELRNWRSYFAAWIGAQRSYAHALAGWALECTQQHQSCTEDETDSSSSSIAPPLLPIVQLCLNWSSLVDSVSEVGVSEGIDMFAAGVVKSLMMIQQQKEGAVPVAVTEVGGVVVALDQSMTEEVRDRVLCAAMSKAMGSLTEFAASFAGGYEVLLLATKLFEEDDGREEGRVPEEEVEL